ncbi:MAG: SMC-Scp complex subunit ScpB [Vicinamibacteria bacterium]
MNEETAPLPPDVEVSSETEEPAPGLSLTEVQASVEALFYASAEPLSAKDLKKALPEAGDKIRPALELLKELYQRDGRGLQLVEVAGGFQITTRPEYHEVVSRIFESPKPARLSIQALETLAVIAYRQPVTVPEIMDLRGVRSPGVVRTLLERKLVRIVGRKNVVGRPLMYGTTKEFLLRFGLKDLKDLPQLKDMSEVFGDEVAQQLEVLDGLPAVEAGSVAASGAEESAPPLPEDDEDGDAPGP